MFKFNEEWIQSERDTNLYYIKTDLIPIKFGNNNIVSCQAVVTYNKKKDTKQTDIRIIRGYTQKDNGDIRLRKAVSLPPDKEVGIEIIKQLIDLYELEEE